jgi:hypothetical protein
MDTRWTSQTKTKIQGIRTTLPDLAVELPSWLPKTIVVLTILVASSIYLWPSPLEFPMDDSYIHFVYAKNLSEHGRLFFNTVDEKGVGTSSLLWVLILGAGNLAGLSMHWVAKLVGIACLAAVGIGLYKLLCPLLSPWVAFGGALLVIISGHMLWFALSGMETMLFLALGILALLCYRKERWGWLGVALGLLIITRLEGMILALVIGGFDIWRRRGIRSGLVVTVVVTCLICCPWILYLWLRTGYFIPTSGIGRHFSNITSIQVATANSDSLAWLSGFPALAYPLTWIGYSIEFILGGFALPAPYIFIDLGIGSFSYKLSVWAILGLATVVLPLLWISCRRLVIYLKSQSWEKDMVRLPLLIFLFWVVLHNLCYMIYLPILGSASRYASLNHIALWLAFGLGISHLGKSRYKFWLAAGLTIIALANTVYWNRVYDANLEHMLKVRIPAAEYIRKQIPDSETCAAFDVGALRYYSQRPLVDLGGLIDPNLIQWFTEGRFDQYLIENKVTCLVIPGRTGTTADGVIDIAKESGFSQSNLFKLQQVKVFQIDRERWFFGYLPTVNYQATVTVYKLIE